MYPQREMILDTFNYFVSSDFCRYLRYSVDCMFRYLETTNVAELDTSNTTVMFLSVARCLPLLPASPTSITTKPHTRLLTHSSQRREGGGCLSSAGTRGTSRSGPGPCSTTSSPSWSASRSSLTRWTGYSCSSSLLRAYLCWCCSDWM